MEARIIKKIKTSCPFPLLCYKTNVKYKEVRKPSGVAYILLDLIHKTEASDEKICDVLLKFGIPKDLHYIFGKEIAKMIATRIVGSNYGQDIFVNPKYFSEIKIQDVSLTVLGLKMFMTGAIPTGEEKSKIRDIYYSPVTRKFDLECNLPHASLASCYLGDEFLDKVEIDISGMEDYINANARKIELKTGERMTTFQCEEPQKLHTRKEEGMTIIIRPSGVEFAFDTTDETNFFYKYYSSALMTKGLLVKNNYKFVNTLKELVQVPMVSIEELDNIANVYLPSDVQKQAERPCKVFLNKGNLVSSGNDSAVQINALLSRKLLDKIDKNAEFALVDNSTIHVYDAVNVSMPCDKFGDIFEMQLLVEYPTTREQYENVVQALFNGVKDQPFDAQTGKTILFAVDGLQKGHLFKEYADAKLSMLSTADEKIELLMKMHSAFGKSVLWKSYFEDVAGELMEESADGIKLDNMIYKNTILTPIRNALNMSEVEYADKFVKKLIGKEDPDLIYQALEAAGFETNVILGVVNVVEDYMQRVVAGQNIQAETGLAAKYQNVKINLWKLNNMLGIKSVSEYTIKDDYNVIDFFDSYSTLQSSYKGIEGYKQYAPQEYAQVAQMMKIYEPIHDILSIEKNASAHPDRITEDYIKEYLSRGKYKEAICDLLVKLQYDLRNLLSVGNDTSAHDLIEEAIRKKLIDKKKGDGLHKLRMCRNNFQHPERAQIPFDRATIEQWCRDVFSLKEEKQ